MADWIPDSGWIPDKKKQSDWIPDMTQVMDAENEATLSSGRIAGAMAGGAVAYPLSGLVGAGTAAVTGGNTELTGRAMQAVGETYSPKLTPEEESVVNTAMYPFEKLREGADVVQREYKRAGTAGELDPGLYVGSGVMGPEAAPLIGTAAEAIPLIVGPKIIGKAKEGAVRGVKAGAESIREVKGMDWVPDVSMPERIAKESRVAVKDWVPDKTEEVKVAPVEEVKVAEPVVETPVQENTKPQEQNIKRWWMEDQGIYSGSTNLTSSSPDVIIEKVRGGYKIGKWQQDSRGEWASDTIGYAKTIKEAKQLAEDSFKKEVKAPEPVVEETPKVIEPTATEPPSPQEGVGPTGVKKAVISEERAQRSLEDVEGANGPKFETALEEAKNLVDSGQRDPRAMAAELSKNPRPLNTVDTGILDYDRMRIKNDYKTTSDAIEQAIDKGDSVAEAEARAKLKSLEDAYDMNDTAGRLTGSRSGESLGARRLMVNEDYSLAAMVQKYKIDTGAKEVPADVRTRLAEHSKRITELEAELAAAKGKKAATGVEKIKAEVDKEKRQAKRTVTKQELSVEFDSLVKELNKTLGGQLNVGLDPTAIAIIGKMAKNRVHSGIITVEGLVDSIYTAVKKMGPEISKREIRDAISGYGITKQLSKEQINVQLRELKAQMRLISAYEDAVAGKSPLRSGLQRDLPSNTVRELKRKVEDMMKEKGINTKSPEAQWKTSLDAVKTRLKNEIADKTKQIKTGEKSAPKKGIVYDTEAKMLQTYRNALNTILELTQEKKGMPVEQRIRMAVAAAEKAVSRLERMIESGNVKPQPKASTTPVTAELKSLRDKRDALQKKVNEMRKAGNPKTDPAFAKLKNDLKAAEKSIGEFRRKILEQDFAPKAKKPPAPHSTILAEAREYRDALKKTYQDMKKEAKPKKTTEEITESKLQAFRKRKEKEIANLEDKMKRGDYSKQEKKPGLELGKKELDLEYQLDQAKRKYMEGAVNDKMTKRSRTRKVGDFLMELPNAFRSYLTSGDLSAVLNQGGFFVTHPITMLKQFPDMLRALVSEKGRFVAEERIRKDVDYRRAKQSDLFLSEHGTTSLSNMEEAFMSRWVEKIPGVAASQRAYTTFLNTLRYDIFKKNLSVLEKGGKKATPAETKAIANMINVATGRGNMGLKANTLVGANTVFFAPRNVISRFQMVLGQPLIRSARTTGITSGATKIIAKEYARYLGVLGVVYGLAELAGAEVEYDPRSTDFGKIQIGNTKVDPLLGMSQVIVLMSRLATGEKLDANGRVQPITNWDEHVPFGGSDVAVTIGRFLRSKLAPGPGMAIDLRQGQDYVGKEMDAENLGKKFIPIAFNDIYDTMQEQGIAGGTVLALLSILGLRVSTYDPKDRR
jgi:hypothetical protein